MMLIRKITVVHNNPARRQNLINILVRHGCEVDVASDGQELLENAIAGCDAAIVDTNTIEIWDKTFMQQLRSQAPDLPLVLSMKQGRIEGYVALLSTGAWDYLAEPFDEHAVGLMLHRLDDQSSLLAQNRYLWSEIENTSGKAAVPTCDARMTEVLRQVGKVAATDASVLILGENGTEKDKIARLIHKASAGCDAPFIHINCRKPREELMHNFFGDIEKLLAMARGGTLYLDEVMRLDKQAQARLLRILEDYDAPRVVCSSSDEPFECVERHEFREDLFFRLNATQIFLPPLRERTDDIPFLASKFMDELGMDAPETDLDALTDYDWPGNVSELEATINLASIRRGSGSLEDLLPKNRRGGKRRRFRN